MIVVLVPVLIFIAVLCLGGALILSLYSRRRLVQERLKKNQPPMAGTPPSASERPQWGLLKHLGQMASLKGASPKLKRALTQAGFNNPAAPTVYLGVKLGLFVLAGAVMLVIYVLLGPRFEVGMLMIFGVSALGFFLPNIYVEYRRRARCTNVRHHLPDAMDLLEVCVSAGMGLDMAWNLVADEIRQVSSTLGDEMALTSLEMRLGISRAEAMRHLTERTGADELASLVAALVQSERFGTSIGEILRQFAVTMRELRSQHAEETAEKMAVQLLFPMIVFIFPAILIVTAGPAGIIIARVLGNP